MPSKTPRQMTFIRAEYGRAAAGKPTRTGMSVDKLKEWVDADEAARKFVKKPKGGALRLPE